MIKTPKQDFGTLRTAAVVRTALDALRMAEDRTVQVDLVARIVLLAFDDYYTRLRAIPVDAKRAFEARDWRAAVALSQERIAIYSVSLVHLRALLDPVLSAAGIGAPDWAAIADRYRALAVHRYEADLAVAYLESLRRALHGGIWRSVVPERQAPPGGDPAFLCVMQPPGEMTAALAADILRLPAIDAPFRDLPGDAAAVAARVNTALSLGPERPLERVAMVHEGFYRNRGAYLIGEAIVAGVRHPLALALLHRDGGLVVDAVITRSETLSHVFSSTLANFHAAIGEYHELVDFLHALMPLRPHGQHYSTIGYNHLGKVAIMRDIEAALPAGGVFDHAPGPRGSVAMAFTAPDLPFVLKVIRDTPTENYKWETFDGVEAVLSKYRSVHTYNRSGSMLDNIIYSNTPLPRAMFDETFLAELLSVAGSVRVHGDQVLFGHLIVQRKLTPVPIFLEGCTPREAELVVIRLGQCIRNNAATNVFNRDLDARNYGVSSLRFVYLFDYDAVDTLTEVKVRTNIGRDEGEEEPPDWFFEEGVVFLPEELEPHLRLPSRALKRLFREAHGELLTAAYWERMQGWLREGRVPRVRTYPRDTQLTLDNPQPNMDLLKPG